MRITAFGERHAGSRGKRTFHAPGDTFVRGWEVQWSAAGVEVLEGPWDALASAAIEPYASYEAARERAAALCAERAAEGWLEVARETNEDDINELWCIPVPEPDPGAGLRGLVQALEAFGGSDAPPARLSAAQSLSDAVREGDLALATAFLDKGSDPSEQQSLPLRHAARRGDLALVNLLLARGADPAPTGLFVVTPLQEAVRHGRREVAERLIDAGADVSKPGGLFLGAVLAGDRALAQRFVDLGADVNWCPDPNLTWTPLEFALAQGSHAMVTWIAELGGTFRPKPTAEEEEASDRQEALLEAIEEGDEEEVRSLLAAGAAANPKRGYEDHPLASAAEKGHPGIVRLLLDHGASAVRYFDSPPLLEAARSGSLEVVKLIHAAGAPIDQPDEDGYTPLMAAASEGHMAIAAYLVENGANVDAWGQGDNPLACAASHGCTEMYAFLEPLASEETRALASERREEGLARAARSAKLHPELESLVDAIMDEDLGAVERLLQVIPPDAEDEEGTATPLLFAARLGRAEMIERMIEWGADLNHQGGGADAPLSAAVTEGHVEAARLLLEAGADPNLRHTAFGRTPLMELCERGGSIECMRLLIAAGADVNLADEGGRTALILGCQGEAGDATDQIRLLAEAGADLDARDGEGCTALMTARLVAEEKDTRASSRRAPRSPRARSKRPVPRARVSRRWT